MSARCGCSTEIHLRAITSAIAASVEGLKKILKWISDAQINDESTSDGKVCLNIQCPEQNCGHMFIENLEKAIDALAQYALDGFFPSSMCTRATRALISMAQRQRKKPLPNETGISAKPLAIWKKKATISNPC
jgi:hypothetical protein